MTNPFSTKHISDVFDETAAVYDRMNNAMSLGLHHTWKDILIQSIDWHWLAAQAQHEKLFFLDVAGGTGDISYRLMQKSLQKNLAHRITLVDRNKAMLLAGKKRYPASTWEKHHGDALALPVRSNTAHLYVIAFGLRNMPQLEKALHEAWRVLKPGGLFYCLEFSQPPHPCLHGLLQLYLKTWLPLCAYVVGKNKQAPYTYLRHTIQTFPKASLIDEILDLCGFQSIEHKMLCGGIVAIHSARKPA